MTIDAGSVPQPRHLARQMFLSALANLAPPAAGFAIAPLLAQALGPEQRGIVAAATAPMLLMTTLAMVGIPETITYLIARDSSNSKQALKKGLLLLAGAGLLATITVLLLAKPLSGGDPLAADLIKIAALFITPTTLISGIRALPRGLHDWQYVNLEKYITSSCRLLVIFGVFACGFLSPLAAVLALSAAPVVGGFVFIKPLINMRKSNVARHVPIKSITSFSLVIWLGSVSGIILGKIDQAIMLPLSDARNLGYYAAAASVADAVLVVNNAVRDVTFSAQSGGSDPNILLRSARISLLVGSLLSAVLLIPINVWFPFLFGHEFETAVPVVVVLTIASVVGIPGSIAGAGLVGRGRPGVVSISLVVAAAVNVLAVIVLVPSMGAGGAAIATLIGNVIASNLNITILSRIYGVSFVKFYAIRLADIQTVWIFIRRLLGKLKSSKDRGL